MPIGLHDLKPAKGAVKNKKRLGRGPGSGTGMVWLVRLAGSELDAHMARIERTASFMAVSFLWSGLARGRGR